MLCTSVDDLNVTAQIVDLCTGCSYYDIGLSLTPYAIVANVTQGLVVNVTWFVDGLSIDVTSAEPATSEAAYNASSGLGSDTTQPTANQQLKRAASVQKLYTPTQT